MIGLLFFGLHWNGEVLDRGFCSGFKIQHPQTHHHLLVTARHCLRHHPHARWSWHPESTPAQSIGVWTQEAQVIEGQDIAYWDLARGGHTKGLPLTQTWPREEETILVRGYPASSLFQEITCQYRGIRMESTALSKDLRVRVQLECPAARYQGLSGGMAIRENGEILGVLVGGNMTGFRPAQELLVEPLWWAFQSNALASETVSSVYQGQRVQLTTLGTKVLSYEVRSKEGVAWAAWKHPSFKKQFEE